jgi:hypothetical protein
MQVFEAVKIRLEYYKTRLRGKTLGADNTTHFHGRPGMLRQHTVISLMKYCHYPHFFQLI